MRYVVYTWDCNEMYPLEIFDEEYEAVNYCQLLAEKYDGRIDYKCEVEL